MSVSMTFSDRVFHHPRIRAFPNDPDNWHALAVVDLLLVCETAWQTVHELLGQERINHSVVTTVLDGLPALPGSEDVRIVKVELPAGRDIFDLTVDLRQSFPGDTAGKVSPNHVIIPAMENHGCPWGPPSPVTGTPPPLGPVNDPLIPVTIIDSGYLWDRAWGDNPLDTYGPIVEQEEEYVGEVGWLPGNPDRVPTDGTPLYALAGHANFIAGVIAQHFDSAKLTIRNHNGAFEPAADDFPTEASVARSLCQSGGAKVIDLGFAFATFDHGPISCVWELALNQIGSEPIVVAPAGNNDDEHARYPAALGDKYANIIGVGSVDRLNQDGTPKVSAFSNHGGWVKCSARGTKVKSTFLKVDMPVEDGKKGKSFNFANAWAWWNGTSFATPKVVAAIAREVANGSTTADATTTVLAENVVDDPAKKVGKVLAVG